MKAMSTCSKAPRGLFVHVEVGRVFTAIAISPSKPSRQLLARYAIDAGQNLPGKELRSKRFKFAKYICKTCNRLQDRTISSSNK